MSTPIKPWSNHRQVLWAIGVVGLLLSGFGLFMAWLFQGGFGPGKQTSPPGLADVFGTMLLTIPCVYYIVVAHRPWTRKLRLTGVVIHAFVLIVLFVASLQHRGGTLPALPVLLIGPVTWVLYAKRNTFGEQSGGTSG